MAIYRLTSENFDSVIHNNKFVIVDFWAEWCSTCTSFAPIYIQISDAHPKMIFGKVDTQIEQDISIRYRIQSIPTLIGFRDGEEVYRKPGAIPGQVLEEIVAKIQSDTTVKSDT